MEGPSAPPAESPVRDKYQCPVCQAEFVLEQSRRRHVRKQHPEAASSLSGSAKASYSCDKCTNVLARRGQLLQHHEQNHGFVSRLSTHQFSSYSDFAAWKEMEEMKEKVKFIASSGPKHSSSGVMQMCLLCNRSGMHVKAGEGKRQPKLVGSVKCNKHCFATMAVTQEGENVTVEYQAERYGHDKSVKHQRLTSTQKNAIAAKLSLGVPSKRILLDAHATGGDELNVLHTLNRHDVYNVKRKFHIGYEEQKDPDEFVSMRTWIDELQETSALLYANKELLTEQGIGKFKMALMNSTQKEFLLEYGKKSVSIDSTYGTNSHGLQLTTLLVIGKDWSGIPCAYLLSRSTTEETMVAFFRQSKTDLVRHSALSSSCQMVRQHITMLGQG
ncbi:uncharacterized protein LOC144112334 [Amblyomma americanum]